MLGIDQSIKQIIRVWIFFHHIKFCFDLQLSLSSSSSLFIFDVDLATLLRQKFIITSINFFYFTGVEKWSRQFI